MRRSPLKPRLSSQRFSNSHYRRAQVTGDVIMRIDNRGSRESAESWKTGLRDLKRQGLRPPVVAVGDGALGFWAAVRDVWPKTREQRDWFHKLGNILDKLPKRLQPRVKPALHEVMYAETRAQAREVAQRFATEHGPKYPEGRHDPGEGRRRAAYVLRLSRRALEASPPHVERDRVAVRDGAAVPARDQGRGVAHEGALDGLQAPGHGAGAMATPRRRGPAAARPRRHRLRGWRPAEGKANKPKARAA
jgi:Transposase, Mutator family